MKTFLAAGLAACLLAVTGHAATPEQEASAKIKAAIKAAKKAIVTQDNSVLAGFVDDLDARLDDYKAGTNAVLETELGVLRANLQNLAFNVCVQNEGGQVDGLTDEIEQILADAGLTATPKEAQSGAFADLDKFRDFLVKENARIHKKASAKLRAFLAAVEQLTDGAHTMRAVLLPLEPPHVAIASGDGQLDYLRDLHLACLVAGSDVAAEDDGRVEVGGYVDEGDVVVGLLRAGSVVEQGSFVTPNAAGNWSRAFSDLAEGIYRVRLQDGGNVTALAVEAITVP